MKQVRSAIFKTLRLLTLASVCIASTANADEYGDASQLVRANKFAEAMVKVDAYLATKPADPQMRFLKGVILRNLGKPSEAISTFTKLTEDFPELPEPYNNLAVLYAGQGQYDKARVALEMAIRTNPSYATAHENIGDVYARLASQAYNKALQLDSANVAVAPKLALIREVFKPNLANPRPVATAPVMAPVVPASVVSPVSPVNSAPVTKPSAVPAPPPTAPIAKPAMSSASSGSTATTAKSNSSANDSDSARAVEAAVLAWAQAWSAKDMTTYLAAYGPDFTPAGKHSRSTWEQDRRDRITGKAHINVKITDLSSKVNGDDAVVKFRQTYKADALSVSSRKTLVLHKTGGQWLISKESTGN